MQPTSRSTRPARPPGVPLNVIGSLRAPTLSWDTEAEALRDEIEGTVTSLLGLVGIEADPLSSREHVLLSNLIENAWRAGPRPRPRDADRRDPVAADPQARRVRDRPVLPARPTARSSHSRSTPSSPRRRSRPGARATRSTRRRSSSRADGEAALRGRLPRAPLRRGAPVRRHARLLEARHLDARPGGHARPPRARVHGRGLRLRPADRAAAGEEADPDDPQAGPRLRPRARALDAEPGRPRLQGDVERRHLARRPPADRERQGARARRAPLRRRRHRRRRARPRPSAASEKRQFLLVSAKASRAAACSPRAGRCRTSAAR